MTCIVCVPLQVFELMKKQEETRQAEEKTKTQEFAVMQAQQETVRTKHVMTAKLYGGNRSLEAAPQWKLLQKKQKN